MDDVPGARSTPETWLPLVAHAVLSCLWWGYFGRDVKVSLSASDLWVCFLAGGLVWPFWGGFRLVEESNPTLRIIGGVFMLVQIVLFLGFLPALAGLRG
jgi:hypothetical protein